MYHGDPRPEDQAADAAMAATYQQLDDHDLSTDPPFDAQAGLQRLTERIDRELSPESPPPAQQVTGQPGAAADPVQDRLPADIAGTQRDSSHASLHLAAAGSRYVPKSIGLWGGPSSGKTTFLSALNIAVNQATQDMTMFGADEASSELLVEGNQMLANSREFPHASQTAGSYRWAVNMRAVAQPKPSRLSRQDLPVPASAQFNIDLLDSPGRVYGSEPMGPETSRFSLSDGGAGAAPDPVQTTDHLADREGLLLLIDPVRERLHGDAYRYFQATLAKVARRRLAAMPPGSRLPHFVAVCITKFDDPEVYRFARMRGFLTHEENDPYMLPRVKGNDAESFFRELCDTHESHADLFCNSLRRYFYPDRIRFFVTSAIGFYLNDGRFREDDYQNVVEQGDGTFRIRGQIHPINVLEPVLWLGRNVTA